jgi:acyl-CoA thioesterase I
VRYVAVGDSYTIGTAVPEAERWPAQLAGRIPSLELVANLGVNGATSGDLIASQLPMLDELAPDVVSVLVGVNDVVAGVSDAEYAAAMAVILDDLAARVGPARTVCVATPDYTVMPRGGEFGDPARQSDAILRFNAIAREAAEQREVRFVPETFEISREAVQDRSLVANDGLHPSGNQYARWVDVIEPLVRELVDVQ